MSTETLQNHQTFPDICNKLGIGEYAECIFKASPSGELSHVYEYAALASLNLPAKLVRDHFLDCMTLYDEGQKQKGYRNFARHTLLALKAAFNKEEN